MSVLKTYEQWNSDGYYICKGSRSVGKNDEGQCLFDSTQVTKKSNKATNKWRSRHWTDNLDYSEQKELDLEMGFDGNFFT